MALDRDLAIAVVRALPSAPRTGWEATAATGVRGLRLVRETGGFDSFVLTESAPRSFDVLRGNARTVAGATALLADGSLPPSNAPFGYVDLDPYGSPLPYLPAGVAATRAGGTLAVTATDLTVLAGAQPSACRRRYGAEPVRGRLGPEGAVRILLATVLREAVSQGRSARPLLGYVGGHHVRAYVEIRDHGSGPDAIGAIRPDAWTGPPVGSPGPFGPMWLGPLVDPSLAERLAPFPSAARPRELEHLLAVLHEEAAVPAPFYYEANSIARRLRLPAPPPRSALVEALRAAGCRASRTHVRSEGIRTDADRARVEAIARAVAARGP